MRFSLLALALACRLAAVAAAPTSRPPPRQSVSLSLFGRPKIGPRRTASSTSSSNSTNTSAAASSSAPPPSKPSGPPAPLPPLQKYICQLVNDLPRPADDGKLYVRPPGGENMSGRELALKRLPAGPGTREYDKALAKIGNSVPIHVVSSPRERAAAIKGRKNCWTKEEVSDCCDK